MPRPEKLSTARAPSRATTDRELLEGLRRASEPHFNELYERYFQRIYNFVQARLRNHADAEEVTQETFTSVFRAIDSFCGRSSLSSWIYGIAKNTVNNHLRRAKAQEARLEKAAPECLRPVPSLGACAPDEHLDLRRYLANVRARLAEVAPWQAEVFELRHLQNLPIQEIADRTSRSNDAVRSCLYRMKRLLLETSAVVSDRQESQTAAGVEA